MSKAIRLIGAPVDTGGPTAGCLMGPEALRQAGLVAVLARHGRPVSDVGDLDCQPLSPVQHPNAAIRRLATSAQWVRTLQAAAYRYADGQSIPVFLGGDHLMAAGTIPALTRRAAERGRPLFVLWLDAHTDFHSLDSTRTGNLHGVPAAYVCGQPGFEPTFPAVSTPLPPANLCMLGIRSVDPAESDTLQTLQTQIIDMATLQTEGVAKALAPFLQRVRDAGGELHLSFDVDCLDPRLAPGVGTRVEDGVSYEQAEQIMLQVHRSGLLSSVDIAELNPLLDNGAQSAKVMVNLMNTLFHGATESSRTTTTPAEQTSAAPGADGQVAYLSVNAMRELVQSVGLEPFLLGLAERIHADFQRWPEFDKTPRVPAHSKHGVIELMPTSDGRQYAFKYVNGHPQNTRLGLQTVTAFGCLADVDTGYPLLLSEMTLLTALRTAATSAMVARYLARANARCMAIIGNGAQCEFQALAFKACLGITHVRLFDIDPQATAKAVRNLTPLGFQIECCASARDAVQGADIITTITADKQLATIITDDMVAPGVHINAVGGDCPGKTELDAAILRRADVFVEFPPQTRIEGEIQQLPPEHPVIEMWQVLRGDRAGRSSDTQITVFDSVGFAVEDFSALQHVYAMLKTGGAHQSLQLIANPIDPKNLIGELLDDVSAQPVVGQVNGNPTTTARQAVPRPTSV